MHTTRIARHLNYANVMATLGVFIALGGASYAAVALPAHSVGTKELKRNAVTASTLKRNAVSSAKVRDGSLQRGDFASGTLVQGPQGPQGLQGPKGDPGQNGASGQQGAPGTARAFAFVDPTNCTGPAVICPLAQAKNILEARRVNPGQYCVKPAPGIDAATSGAAVGVDVHTTAVPEGNASAMADSVTLTLACPASQYRVVTTRIPPVQPTVAAPANDVGFWLLVP